MFSHRTLLMAFISLYLLMYAFWPGISAAQPSETRRIVYSAYVGNENPEIYTMNLDGSDVRQLTDDNATDDAPKWSPDGSIILFESWARDGVYSEAIYTMDANGNNITRVIEDGFHSTWSPDGTQIAFVRSDDMGSAVYVANADGSDIQKITSSDGSWFDMLPTWSPDGTQIVFISDRNYDYSPVTDPWDIYLTNVSGSVENFVVNLPSRPYRLNWLSDGETLIFDVRDLGHTVYDYNMRTQVWTALRSPESFIDLQYSFSPNVNNDETVIVFDDLTDIYRMDRDGFNRVNLTNSNELNRRKPDIQPVNIQGIYVTSATLVDAVDGALLHSLLGNPSINPLTQTENPAVRVNVYGSPGSVVFNLDGVVTTDNDAPFTVPLDTTPGARTLTATPYSGPDGTGDAGTPLTVNFTVVGRSERGN